MVDLESDSLHPLEACIAGARNGDEEALNRLAEYLLPKAFEIAKFKMQVESPMDDFEDIAISAVKSVCIRFRQGSCEFLGEKELGSLLRQFVMGKIRDRRKYHAAEKRQIKLNAAVQRSSAVPVVEDQAWEKADSIWLDEQSAELSLPEQAYLQQMLDGLGADVHGLFAELVKRLDDKSRKVMMLITSTTMTNMELADALDCAPSSIERYRRAIRKKLDEIVNG